MSLVDDDVIQRIAAIVPVLLGDRVVGTFDVQSDRVDAFSEREVTGFEQIAAVPEPLWSER